MLCGLHKTSGHAWLAAWVLFATLLLGQFGPGPGLLAATTGALEAHCGPNCPCQSTLESKADADHDHVEGEPCPVGESGDECPPGCDDCMCCAAVVVAVAPKLVACPVSALVELRASAPTDAPASGVLGRIFRPPRASLV